MELKMYLEGELIDSMPVFPSVDYKVHLNFLKYQLLQKHAELMGTVEYSPSFVLEGVPSAASRPFSSLLRGWEASEQNNPLFPNSKKHKE